MRQIVSLERTCVRGGKIDHPRGLHDDIANAAAGALVLAYQDAGVSPGQQLRDNLKIAAHFKRYARSFV